LTLDQFIFWPKLPPNAGFGIKNLKKSGGDTHGPPQREGATISRTQPQHGYTPCAGAQAPPLLGPSLSRKPFPQIKIYHYTPGVQPFRDLSHCSTFMNKFVYTYLDKLYRDVCTNNSIKADTDNTNEYWCTNNPLHKTCRDLWSLRTVYMAPILSTTSYICTAHKCRLKVSVCSSNDAVISHYPRSRRTFDV